MGLPAWVARVVVAGTFQLPTQGRNCIKIVRELWGGPMTPTTACLDRRLHPFALGGGIETRVGSSQSMLGSGCPSLTLRTEMELIGWVLIQIGFLPILAGNP